MKLLLTLSIFSSTSGECINKTVSGRDCQRWDSEEFHKPRFLPIIKGNNCCRAADPRDPQPFCYTTDPNKRWEYCNASMECYRGRAQDYDGPVSKTKSGLTCQNWQANSPHRPKYRSGNHNFCRSPDGDSQTWCYTTNPNRRWEYCDIPKCTTPTVTTTTSSSENIAIATGIDENDPLNHPKCGLQEREFQWDGLKSPTVVNEKGDIDQQVRSETPSDDEYEDYGISDYGNMTTYIYGGNNVKSKRAPWQVKLDGPAGCGGTLVSLSTVITAAHCVVNSKPIYWRVSAGHIAKYSSSGYETGFQRSNVKSIHVHPEYNRPRRHNHDIAVMKLESPFTYTDFVRPACLPDKDFEMETGWTAITGWGATEQGSTQILKKTTVPMWKRQKCTRALRTRITEAQICAGATGLDTCQGDSGGPLVAMIYNETTNQIRWTLTGVTSWGYGCGRKGSPGVYANVANHLEWLSQYL